MQDGTRLGPLGGPCILILSEKTDQVGLSEERQCVALGDKV